MKRSFAALAAVVAVMATLLAAGVATAHAPITYIEWAPDMNPSHLIAKTNNREMVADPGSFYVRVYNSSGARVDTGTMEMAPDRLQITVALQANLPPGTYRVDWLTTSTDGEVLSGSESVPLPGSFGEPPSAPVPEEEHEEGEEHEAEEMTGGEAVAPPATGDGGLLSRPSTGQSAFAIAAVVLATMSGAALALRRTS